MPCLRADYSPGAYMFGFFHVLMLPTGVGGLHDPGLVDSVPDRASTFPEFPDSAE